MKNTKQQFKEWATDCAGYSPEDITDALNDNIWQITDHIPDDAHILQELKFYLTN